MLKYIVNVSYWNTIVNSEVSEWKMTKSGEALLGLVRSGYSITWRDYLTNYNGKRDMRNRNKEFIQSCALMVHDHYIRDIKSDNKRLGRDLYERMCEVFEDGYMCALDTSSLMCALLGSGTTVFGTNEKIILYQFVDSYPDNVVFDSSEIYVKYGSPSYIRVSKLEDTLKKSDLFKSDDNVNYELELPVLIERVHSI